MAKQSVINVDLADVFAQPDRKGFLHTLGWGDSIEVLDTTTKHLRISTVKFEERDDGSILPVKTEAYISPTKTSGFKPADVVIPKKDNRVLKINFVDVQQGDGAVIEARDGKIILLSSLQRRNRSGVPTTLYAKFAPQEGGCRYDRARRSNNETRNEG